jgi:hypothetical protein
VRPRPRDAYSPLVARQLRDAARADLAAIDARLRAGPRFDEVPEIEAATRRAHTAIEARGVLYYRDAEWQALHRRFRSRNMPAPDMNISLHAAHHLTAADIVPLLVLLSLETGLELECCKTLTIDCLRNASGGTVDIAYTKLRAHGAEHKTIRVRDGGSTTPGGLIRRIIAHSAKARAHNPSIACGSIISTARSPTAFAIPARPSTPGLLGTVSSMMQARRSICASPSCARRTRPFGTSRPKDTWPASLSGIRSRSRRGITPMFPSLRPLHEQTVADALEEAVAGPRLLPPLEEALLRDSASRPRFPRH